jgi:hypothetical protein
MQLFSQRRNVRAGSASGRVTRRCMGLGIALVAAALAAACDPAQGPSAPVCFTVEDPYAQPGTWYRSNFHMHSKHSDGALFPEDLVREYHKAGYGVLCITDHNSYGDQDGGVVKELQNDSLVHDWNGDGVVHPERQFGSGTEAFVRDWTQPSRPWSMDSYVHPEGATVVNVPILFSGSEATYKSWHIGLVGYPPGPIEAPSTTLDFIPRTTNAGGFVFLAHPAAWNDSPRVIVQQFDLRAFDALEVINGLQLTMNRPADATRLWDALLSSGYRLWGMANDDSHTWVGAENATPFTAFDLVEAAEATPSAVMQALHRGSFYGSTGLTFSRLGVAHDSLQVWAPLAERLRFIGSGGRVLLEVAGRRAAYAFRGSEGYVRVEAVGKPTEGGHWPMGAWSQPFYVHVSPCAAGTSRDPERR